jgi:hypothetical protein
VHGLQPCQGTEISLKDGFYREYRPNSNPEIVFIALCGSLNSRGRREINFGPAVTQTYGRRLRRGHIVIRLLPLENGFVA